MVYMNIIQTNPPIIKHPEGYELMYPNNVHDEEHLKRIKDGYERQRQHMINKLKVHTKRVYGSQGYDTKFLNENFKGLFGNDPENKYKILSVPLPSANA